MLLPPCRPLLPPVVPRRHRRSPQFELSRAHSPCGLRLNLSWALNLLAAIPGPHQRRIVSQAAEDAQQTRVLPHAAPQQDEHQQGQATNLA